MPVCEMQGISQIVSLNPISPHHFKKLNSGYEILSEQQENFQQTSVRNTTLGISLEQAVFLLILFGSFMFAFFPTWKGLVSAWYHSDDSFGFFIPPVCVFIGWLKRDVLSKLERKPSRLGLGLVIAGLLFYLIGRLGEITTLAALSILPTLAGVILFLWGAAFLKELLFPLFLMLCMIPVPAQIYSAMTIPLQLWVSQASTWLAGLLGVAIYSEGNVITLPHKTLEVVQACSGLRSLTTLLSLSAILGYFLLKSNILRAVLIVSALPISIVVNVIRVLALIVCEYYFGFDLNAGTAHTAFGLVIFLLALVMIILVRGGLSFWDRSAVSK